MATPPPGLTDTLERWCQDQLQFGELADSIGYLRITRLYQYAPSGTFEDDSVALEGALNRILPRVQRLRGLVIDVRLNGGGFDALALLIASRLTDDPYAAFTKQTRSDPADPSRFTPPHEVIVRPSPGPRFTGPAVLLTGPFTLSAGEPTQGIFADELIRRLPNGCRFQLSTERYLTLNGRSFEGPGIPPDLAVPVFPRSDRETGKDGVLKAAVRLLAQRP